MTAKNSPCDTKSMPNFGEEPIHEAAGQLKMDPKNPLKQTIFKAKNSPCDTKSLPNFGKEQKQEVSGQLKMDPKNPDFLGIWSQK